MNRFYTLMVILTVFIQRTTAQETYEFEWKDGICNYTGTTKTDVVSEDALHNALYLLWNPSGLTRPFLCNKPADSSLLNIELVQKEYINKRAELLQATFPSGVFWLELQNTRLKELDQQFQLRKLAIQAFKDPQVLAKKTKDKTCNEFVKALTSGDKALLAAWKNMHEAEKLSHSDPESLQAVFDKHWNSPEQMIWAKIELLRYGWWNCVDQSATHVTDFSAIEQQFKALFSEVREKCD